MIHNNWQQRKNYFFQRAVQVLKKKKFTIFALHRPMKKHPVSNTKQKFRPGLWRPGRFAPRTFRSQTFCDLDVSHQDVSDQVVLHPDILVQDVSLPAFLDQDYSPLDILDLDVFAPLRFGPGRFAPGRFGPGHFAPRAFRHGTFWTWTFRTGRFGSGLVAPIMLDKDVLPPPDNCFIIQNICFCWKFCHLGEFTSNFSWRCFTIHVILWRYVRDYVTLTSMRH